MIQAEDLHRRAALLSNTLADFDDDDVDGRKPVVDEILSLREQWKDVRYEIETGQQRRPEKPAKPTTIELGLSEAEIKVELASTRVKISQNKQKLEEKPDHKNAATWQAEYERLVALRDAYEVELAGLKYQSQPKNEGA
jgi:predicted FMN-binding regulatory protein PaiB